MEPGALQIEVREGMYYPDELIEEVRMKNDIVDVISGYVKLQRKGNSYFGLCPFHNESHRLSLSALTSRCIIALGAEQAEMSLLLLCSMKTIRFRRR